MVTIKDQNKYNIKDTVSNEIIFMHYMRWTRVMLATVFEEFEMVYISLLLFSFTIIVNWY